MTYFETCKTLLHRLIDDLEHLENHNPDFNGYADLCLRAALEDNDLPLLVDYAWEQVQEQLQELCTERKLTLAEALENEALDIIWAVADQNTPIYNWVTKALYFLYSNELEEAYQDAGIYETPPANYQQVCICIYLEQALQQRAQQLLEQSPTLPAPDSPS